MAEKVLGPTGSPRRRWTLLLPLVAAIALGLFYITGAQAVHDTGVFQLDGDALTSDDSDPTALEDWDKVCPTDSPPSRPAADDPHCLGGTTASDSTFIADAFIASTDDIFKGGTDAEDISAWQWKQAGPSPDKADIEQAFAAQYTVNAAPYNGDEVLFFGGTRYANNGSTNIGFWFFQQEVTLAGANSVTQNGVVSCPVQSGCGFTGLHTEGDVSLGGTDPGDIFILSEFTQGGVQPTIKIFEWVGPGNATKDYLGSNNCFTNSCSLQPVPIPFTPGFTDNRCAVGVPPNDDPACAIVNAGQDASPWFFTAKEGGVPANTFNDGELYEGGLNLTGLGFGDVCFQSTLLNTRSSPSGTSVLQDFAIGGFGECTSGTVTTPQTGAGASIPAGGISIGTTARVEVRDQAVITVTGVGSFGGTVQFFLCGPLALDSTSNCATGGVQIGTPAAGETVTGTGGTATVNSDTATLTSAGRYCWRAVYSGDSGAGVPGSSDPTSATDTSVTECFKVNPVQPTLTTSAGPDVILGNTISDTASLTGTAKQPGTDGIGPGGTINATAGTQANAAGTITFSVNGPNNCNPSGLAVSGSPVTVNGDNTSYGPVTALPTAVGTYTFIATYSGNSPNTLGAGPSGCPESSEEVVVTGSAASSSKQRWLPNDRVVLTSSPGTTLNGTLTITLYSGTFSGTADNCTVGTATAVTGQSYTHNISGDASGTAYQTGNTTFFVGSNPNGTAAGAAGTYFWLVHYVDTNLDDPADRCETSTVSITD